MTNKQMKRNIWIMIIIVILLSLFALIKTRKNAFKIGNNYISVVVSGSMEKTIKTNDFIVYKEFETYQVDDIIVFSVGDYLVVHRIIENTPDGFITKGDNNLNDDFSSYGYINDNQILGKVTKSFNLLGLGKLLA